MACTAPRRMGADILHAARSKQVKSARRSEQMIEMSFKKIEVQLSEKKSSSTLSETGPDHVHSACDRYVPAAHTAVQRMGLVRAHAARSKQNTSARCFLQAIEASFERLEVQLFAKKNDLQLFQI